MKFEQSDIEALKPLITEIAVEAAKIVLSEAHTDAKPEMHDGNGRLAYPEPEAAVLMGLESHHLREQRRRGKIQYCRGPGNRILYTPAQIAEYLHQENKNGRLPDE